MSMPTPLERLEGLIREMSRRGGAQAQASSTISQILELNRAAQNVIRLAECLSSAKGSCTDVGGSRFCDSRCGSLYLVRDAEGIKLWKVGSQSISIVVSASTFSISNKDYTIRLGLNDYSVRLLSGTFSGEVSAEGLTKGQSLFSNAVRKLLPLVNAVAESLSRCAASEGVRC